MTDASHTRLSRRRLLQLGGAGVTAGALGAASIGGMFRSPGTARADGSPPNIPSTVTVRRALAGTDGWAYLPVPENIPPDIAEFFPDDLAPAPLNAYVYGFVDVTAAHLAWATATNDTDRALAHDQIYKWKGHTQNQSPMLAFDEGDQVEITLYNLGWQIRPDIPDGHTIHWHGFKNATPWFDGVPEMSGAAPINKSFTYFYDCQEPGTYMYHCHWEDVEHIQMGMTGVVFIRPRFNHTRTLTGSLSISGTSVTGTGTRFTTEVRGGDLIRLSSAPDTSFREVASIANDASLTLVTAPAANGSGPGISRGLRRVNLSGTGTTGQITNNLTGTGTLTNNGNGNANVRRRINGTGTNFPAQIEVGDSVKFAGDPDSFYTVVSAIQNNGAVAGGRLLLATPYGPNGTVRSNVAMIVRKPANASRVNSTGGTDFPGQVVVGDSFKFADDPDSAFRLVTGITNNGTRLTLSAAYPVANASGAMVVRRANTGTAAAGDRKFVYNSFATEYDREFPMMLMDYDLRQHQKLAHIQQPDWSEYNPNAWTINGRAYPDTTAPNGVQGEPLPAISNPDPEALRYQPQSALVTANAGDRVLLRVSSLGYQAHAMTMDGIPFAVIGRDANDLGTAVYSTDTIDVSPGESYDVLFTAPDYSGNGTDPDVYMFYDRNYENDNSGGDSAFAGMATEVHVFPAGHLAAQTAPNDWGM